MTREIGDNSSRSTSSTSSSGNRSNSSSSSSSSSRSRSRSSSTGLSDDVEKNYDAFWAFALASSNTLLCVMHSLGYCAQDHRLITIIGEILEMRADCGHVESDAGRHIADFRHRNTYGVKKWRARIEATPSESDIEVIDLGAEAENESEEDNASHRSVSPADPAIFTPLEEMENEEEEEEEEARRRRSAAFRLGQRYRVSADAGRGWRGAGGRGGGEEEEVQIGAGANRPSSQNEREENSPAEEEEEEEEEEAELSHNSLENNDNHADNDDDDDNDRADGLQAENSRRFRNFEILGREASFKIRALPEGSDTVRWIENAFREIHAYTIRSSAPSDYVGLTFDSVDLTHGPAGLSFRPVRDLTHEDIWGLVSSIAQSAAGLDIAESFIVRVFNVAAPTGRGGVSNKLTREDVAKRSSLQLGNTDNLCLPRSLVVARIYCERGNLREGELHKRWNSVRYRSSKLQRTLALELTRNAGITIPEEGCGIREIERFQRFLAAENIAVYNFSTFARGGKLLYDGCELLGSLGREPTHRLNILYYERSRHYNPILNLKAAAGSRGGYCVTCNTGFRNDRGHRCAKRCPRCYAAASCEDRDAEIVKCASCNRSFFGNSCFERHRAEKSYDGRSSTSVCKSVRICDGCGRFVKSNSLHRCNVAYCKTCRSCQSTNHLCFMQPRRCAKNRAREDPGEGTSAIETHANETDETSATASAAAATDANRNRVAFVFYDFETRQDETLEGCESGKIHVPTLCVAQQICEECSTIEDTTSVRCRWCGVREFVFRHDPVKQFVDFATRTTKYFKKIICIAHNAKAFDAQFILKHLVEDAKTREEPRVILNGTKIIVMTVGHTKFIDSVNYMPMRLSDLPKAFGLRDTADKGIFPHLFNTRANQTYVGPLPEVRYYSPEQMKPEERERFLTWHAEMTRKNIVFDFQREIIRYCRNDVDILRRACWAFRKIFLERGGVCPFEECPTIASTCMRIFHKNFLREKEIGLIPVGGYRYADNQSSKALRWLVWMERELGHRIIHAGRGREYRIEGTRVDGYYESRTAGDTNETRHCVLQFHGCFWHSCPACFRLNRDKRLSGREDTIDARYERTLATTWRHRKQGYHVTEKWECDFDRETRENREMRDFFQNHPLLKSPPLDPRDAFYGGRTGNIATLREITGNEKIRNVDVCSLYPYVLKTGAFPIGHPDIYIGQECSALIGTAPNYNFDSVEGLVRCRVLPPRDLFHPVLPYRVRGKLLFGLCRSCCETFSQDACTHDHPADREFVGTWVSAELRKALEKGYLVTEVSELWQYKVTRYDRVTRQGGLFVEYINSFLQLKQEASGWPSECADDEAKERYLREYEEIEGIALDRNNIARNPGLRSVAKLCLNSFWGKFGQRSNLPNTEIVKSPQRFATLLTSPEHEITNILPVNDELLYVSWRLREEAVAASPMTNVVIAAYTTAQARLKLYEYLELLDRRVLYYDTDSCIYVSTGEPDEYEPRTGNFLSDMTDELESYGRGSYIESFVSGGPKFYAYIVRTPEGRTREVCKIKGITLNYNNSLIVNFNSIRKLLTDRGLPRPEDYSNDPLSPKLLIIDDLMRESSSSDAIVDLITKGSHHKNLSVILISQNLFHQGRGQRDISLNANYIVVFKNPRDRAQIRHLARQVSPDDPKFLEEAYYDATSRPHGYLLLDLKQSTPDEYRFRTCIFPDDATHYVYVARKSFSSGYV
ncbi:PREDICTED: uncharacterized protein LOC105556661 [Vollenhovia emeryi]|uniref:uncharacterized protein LOC105556661 n=1 Tax=Vollenhovia emeryi TaxID=411798 RepID=UPI0005F513F4|nr:PREDICTED: uncharacterized protein LOC105556661 [Vollenhovia emeryi]